MYNFAASNVPFEFYQGQFLHLSNDVNHTFAPKTVVLMKHSVLIPLSPDFIFIASAFIMIYPVCPRFYCIENPNTFLIPCIFFSCLHPKYRAISSSSDFVTEYKLNSLRTVVSVTLQKMRILRLVLFKVLW